MASSLRYIALGFIVFLISQQVMTDLDCYSCISCGSKSSSWSTTTTSISNVSCYKYVYSLGGGSFTNRGYTTSCPLGSNGVGGTNYCCSTSLCNRGSSVSSSVSLAMAFIALVSVFIN